MGLTGRGLRVTARASHCSQPARRQGHPGNPCGRQQGSTSKKDEVFDGKDWVKPLTGMSGIQRASHSVLLLLQCCQDIRVGPGKPCCQRLVVLPCASLHFYVPPTPRQDCICEINLCCPPQINLRTCFKALLGQDRQGPGARAHVCTVKAACSDGWGVVSGEKSGQIW